MVCENGVIWIFGPIVGSVYYAYGARHGMNHSVAPGIWVRGSGVRTLMWSGFDLSFPCLGARFPGFAPPPSGFHDGRHGFSVIAARLHCVFLPPCNDVVIHERESTHKVPAYASQAVLCRMLLTLHTTRRTPQGASRLVPAKSAAWSVKTGRAPSRHCSCLLYTSPNPRD